VDNALFKMTLIEETVTAVSESAKPVDQDTYFDDVFSEKTQAEKEIEMILQE
jgi:hypothetical protein